MTAPGIALVEARLVAQPGDVRFLPEVERDHLIISTIQIDGNWIIRSQYGDDIWQLTGGTTNFRANRKRMDFTQVPAPYRTVVKEAMYRYLMRGRDGSVKPSTLTAVSAFKHINAFLHHLNSLKLKHLGAVTPLVCSTYVAACRSEKVKRRKRKKPLSAGELAKRFQAVELLYEMSQFTATPIPTHPWPDSSANHLAGSTGAAQNRRSRTPLIPDEAFTTLFQEAYALMKRGDELLSIRDQLDALEEENIVLPGRAIKDLKNRHLKDIGWQRGLRTFNMALIDLRTACYIIVASLSGCRNHELVYVQTDACYRTEDDDGEVYWWMRSQSDKTGAGKAEWMVPEAAVEALQIMDRWAAPYQAVIAAEIAQRRAADPQDPEIAEAQKHARAVFLSNGQQNSKQVRTLSNSASGLKLKAFAKRCGLTWDLATHQFRRKFANYAARSQFGDLRYLREHFKHWSQDMTNDGYALNESQEMELYAEIWDELEAIKFGLAEQWLSPNEPLAGGYGKNLMDWRSRQENIAVFKDHKTMVASVAASHAIRSNGHAWCTADDNQCIGNTLEKTRCSGCDNAVIGRVHARMYQGLYSDLKQLRHSDDIGPGGQARVQRDLERCRDVLMSLGCDPEENAA
ncbi:MAG: integrase [Lysobacteraceae bacterium]|nr:MAG: integrase [Xanthomonadaceae bacterium]